MLSEYFILFFSFLLHCFPLTCYEVKKDKKWKKPKIAKININKNILYVAGLLGSSSFFMELVNELNIGNLYTAYYIYCFSSNFRNKSKA